MIAWEFGGRYSPQTRRLISLAAASWSYDLWSERLNLAGSQGVLDIDHALEHIRDTSKTLFGEGTVASNAWTSELRTTLLEHEHGVWRKQLVWGRESPEDFGAALWRLACRRGYQEAKEKLFAADGGAWCWDIQARYFDEAVGILDWYHVSEHVWAAAKLVAGAAPDDWAQAAAAILRHHGGEGLIDWLTPQIAPRRGL